MVWVFKLLWFLVWGSATEWLLRFLHLFLRSPVVSKCVSVVCDLVLQLVPSSPIRIPSSRLHQIKQVSTDSNFIFNFKYL